MSADELAVHPSPPPRCILFDAQRFIFNSRRNEEYHAGRESGRSSREQVYALRHVRSALRQAHACRKHNSTYDDPLAVLQLLGVPCRPYPALDKTLDLGFATLTFVLQPKCSALSQDFGVDFRQAADTDSCISAILNKTFSVKDVAALAGFDVGSVTSKIPAFLGITKEKVEGISVKGLALK